MHKKPQIRARDKVIETRLGAGRDKVIEPIHRIGPFSGKSRFATGGRL
jgi:hypothetical protein